MQVHVLSFEGPDPYSRAGGLATRVEGLTQALTNGAREVHLWFVGDPDAPDVERRGALYLHRWCQGISRHHPHGVYDGEVEKEADFARALPARLFDHVLRPALERREPAVILAEEWQTVRAVLHLDQRLRASGLRDRVTILWNANNTFGFEGIDWALLRRAARITTVSRYMKHRMRELGVDALVIPNGLSPDAYAEVDRDAVAALRNRFRRESRRAAALAAHGTARLTACMKTRRPTPPRTTAGDAISWHAETPMLEVGTDIDRKCIPDAVRIGEQLAAGSGPYAGLASQGAPTSPPLAHRTPCRSRSHGRSA